MSAGAPGGDGRPVLRGLVKAVDHVGTVGAYVSTLGMWLLAAVVTVDVGMRLLGIPNLWAAETSVYLMLAIAFLGAGATETADGHFRVTFVRDRFGALGRRIFDALALGVATLVAGAFTWGAWNLASFSWMLEFRTPTVLQVPLWLLQGLMVVGGAFLTLASLANMLRALVPGGVDRDLTAGTGEVI